MYGLQSETQRPVQTMSSEQRRVHRENIGGDTVWWGIGKQTLQMPQRMTQRQLQAQFPSTVHQMAPEIGPLLKVSDEVEQIQQITQTTVKLTLLEQMHCAVQDHIGRRQHIQTGVALQRLDTRQQGSSIDVEA